MIAKALKSRAHPIVVHIVPMRRCNLSCTYCNEFDSVSAPVPAPEMFRRIDLLAQLGTTAITISGGEPLLHPALDEMISRIRSRGMLAEMITNGYLLTPARIRQLNRAGLDHLQISIDNVIPDEVSKKSLKVLNRKLEWLAEHAEFHVNVNSVLGSSIRNPEDALTIAQRAMELGFESTVGLIHDGAGHVLPLNQRQQTAYQAITQLPKPFHSGALYNRFYKNLASGNPNQWQCRAGSRYLYVCEDGLVHYCSQQRGHPGIPLEQYSREHIAREYASVKSCAPYCTIPCVQRVSMIDEFREQPVPALTAFFPPTREGQPLSGLPPGIKLLTAMLLPTDTDSIGKRSLRKLAARLLAA
ncbi:MAG: radical SAM protein [Acidobacteriales bacterium]|nr:radical SAM protein [Terriglobales bacterium]